VQALCELDAQWASIQASIYAIAGLRDDGIGALDVAVRQGYSNVVLIETRDATLAALRDHPRFPDVLRRAREAQALAERLWLSRWGRGQTSHPAECGRCGAKRPAAN
jgi:hypothetical protein